MANLPPYKYKRGEFKESFARWLELVRNCINSGIGSGDAGNVGDAVYLVRTTDDPRDSVIIPAVDTELQVTLAQSTLWAIEGSIKVSGADAEGFKWLINKGLTCNLEWQSTDPDTGTTVEGHAVQGTSTDIVNLGTDQILEFHGTIKTAASAALEFLWSQVVSGATPVTIREGSWIRITRLIASVPAAPVVPTLDVIEALSPTHLWKLDETTGTTAADSGVGTALTGTINATGVTIGQPGPTPSMSSFRFDGATGEVRFLEPFGQPGTSQTGTFLAFINADNIAGSVTNPIYTGTHGTFLSPLMGWTMQFTAPANSGFHWHANIDGTGANQYLHTQTTRTLTANNTWYLVIHTHTGSTHQMYVATATALTAPQITTSTVGTASAASWLNSLTADDRWNIGSFNRLGANDDFFDGFISSVAYWDGTALSQADVTSIFDAFALEAA